MADMIPYVKTTDISSDVAQIIEAAQRSAYTAVDQILVIRNWLLGKRISEEDLAGTTKERYGAQIIVSLSKKLTAQYGKGFDRTSLYRFVQFYQMFPEIVAAVRQQSLESERTEIVAAARQQSSGNDKSEIVASLRPQSRLLSWTHYRILLQVPDSTAREWYAKEAYDEAWSSRTLQRNVSSQYYYRMLKTQDPSGVRTEMQELTSPYQNKLEFIRNPVIAEFLGMEQDKKYHESDLEQTIINNLQKFMMELGKGYAFVARQQHIHTEKDDYYIDLVFYNYILKCFVLIDLKTSKITHQDVGQMDMYIRMYDDLRKRDDDNPTLGLVLCTDTDEDIAKYSVLHGNEQLFASKYKLYLPTDEELRAEIETQKQFFLMQQAESESEE
jgi:predicted nuclease of restriction endonuclease-like (RecB) superfamily